MRRSPSGSGRNRIGIAGEGGVSWCILKFDEYAGLVLERFVGLAYECRGLLWCWCSLHPQPLDALRDSYTRANKEDGESEPCQRGKHHQRPIDETRRDPCQQFAKRSRKPRD